MLGLLGSLLEDNALKQQGFWNASTNTPTLVNGTGVQGYYYVVSVDGTVNFGAGNITFTVGDYVPVNKTGDTITGSLGFSGNGLKITGDFSNATRAKTLTLILNKYARIIRKFTRR